MQRCQLPNTSTRLPVKLIKDFLCKEAQIIAALPITQIQVHRCRLNEFKINFLQLNNVKLFTNILIECEKNATLPIKIQLNISSASITQGAVHCCQLN